MLSHTRNDNQHHQQKLGAERARTILTPKEAKTMFDMNAVLAEDEADPRANDDVVLMDDNPVPAKKSKPGIGYLMQGSFYHSTQRGHLINLPHQTRKFRMEDGIAHKDSDAYMRDLVSHASRLVPWARIVAAPVIVMKDKKGEVLRIRSGVIDTCEKIYGSGTDYRITNFLLSTALTRQEAEEAMFECIWREIVREADRAWPGIPQRGLLAVPNDQTGSWSRRIFNSVVAQTGPNEALKFASMEERIEAAFIGYAMAALDNPQQVARDFVRVEKYHATPFHRKEFASIMTGTLGGQIASTSRNGLWEHRS